MSYCRQEHFILALCLQPPATCRPLELYQNNLWKVSLGAEPIPGWGSVSSRGLFWEIVSQNDWMDFSPAALASWTERLAHDGHENTVEFLSVSDFWGFVVLQPNLDEEKSELWNKLQTACRKTRQFQPFTENHGIILWYLIAEHPGELPVNLPPSLIQKLPSR